MENARASLGRILQNAHSGEIAAAFAYRGHWRSIRNADERNRIRQIEEDEWEHRSRVRFWMEELNIRPKRTREVVFWTIGRILGLLCFVSGWFLPMYFAGRLESRNTAEYSEAAEFAASLGMDACVTDLMHMSDKEREHEEYFLGIVKSHWLFPTARLIFRWG